MYVWWHPLARKTLTWGLTLLVCLISIKSLEKNFQLALLLHSTTPLRVFSYNVWKWIIYPHAISHKTTCTYNQGSVFMNTKHVYCLEAVLCCKSPLWQQLIFATKNRATLPLKSLSSVETLYEMILWITYIFVPHILMKPTECRLGKHTENRLWVSIKKCECFDWGGGLTCGRTGTKFPWCESHKSDF